MNDGVIQGGEVPDELLGPLTESASDSGDELRERFTEDGYVLLRGVLPREDVLAAREEVFSRLADAGEIKSPAVEGIATGASRRQEVAGGLGEFWRSVSEGSRLRSATHGEPIRNIVAMILDEPLRAHDLMYLRPTPVGKASSLHYDYPFFAGFSERICTAWIPLGDVPVCDGPLVIVEGSNRFSDLIDPIRGHDYQKNRHNDAVQAAAYEHVNASPPLSLVRERGTRFLTTDFRAGDLVVFSMFTLHGSLDNHSPDGRVRLSCDVRYQPAADPFGDERYFGAHPTGSKGGGYADMRGAKPLDE